MEANPINACHLAIDDNVFLLNYNKAVVVRNGIAYTNTRSKVRRLVRYSSSKDLLNELVETNVDESIKLSLDESETNVENKGFRLHWLCSLHCEDIFIPCRVSGLHFPCSKMGQLLQLQYLIDCKPDDLYTDSFTKALEYSITRILLQEIQFKEFTMIPGYSILLNWLTPRIKQTILTKIGRILSFQKYLGIVCFEYQLLDTFEAIRLLLSLAQSAGSTLKELYLWYFFNVNSCPFIGQYSPDEERELNKILMSDGEDKGNAVSKNKTDLSFQCDEEMKRDLKNGPMNKTNRRIVRKNNSEEAIEKLKVCNETDKSILPAMDGGPLSSWVENWIMEICGKVIDDKIQDNDTISSTVQCGSSIKQSHSILTIDSHTLLRPNSDESDKDTTKGTLPIDILSSISSKDSETLLKSRNLHLDKSLLTFDEFCKRFHTTSELELFTEVKRRVTQPIKGRPRKMKPAKLRSLQLCSCYEKDFGLDKICSLCQRNAKEDLTYSAFDKLELEREIHQLLYFPLDNERVYFLDDEKKCLKYCQNYIDGQSMKNMEGKNIRMVYKIALAAFTCITRLSINYNYLADGSGETLFCIGSIRNGKLMDLEILCTKYDIPSNSKQSYTYSTRRLSIPNLVWKKIKCICPQLRVHMVMFEISKYNSANSFLSKDLPLTSLHISTGNNVSPVNLLKPGEKLDLWNFDQILKFMGMFHHTLVSLALELWLLPYKTDDTLVKLLMKLEHLERFRYRGPIQTLRTIDRICDFYLTKENIIELKIWKIQEPLLRPEADLEAIKCKEKKYKSEFVNRDVDFALGSFPY